MTGTITVLVVGLSALIIAREGFHPFAMLGAAATGDLVLKGRNG